MRVETLGGLRVRILGGSDGSGGGQGPAVILLHGFGAGGDDLVPLEKVMAAPKETRFLFPEAPLQLQMPLYDARAWWLIDMERLDRAIRSGQPRELSKEVPAGLAEAREKLLALLSEVEEKLRPSKIVLGGFSQGAMLSCDAALRGAHKLAGLVLLSGTIVAEPEWIELMHQRRGLPVFMSHGTYDPLLPVSEAERLKGLLTRAGLPVEWIGFPGAHEIPGVVLEGLGAFLQRVL
jgi:phospholipase/carboxylesterase